MNPRVGQFFHSFHDEDHTEMNWQGKILKQASPGKYRVQLLEWVSGEPSIEKVVSAEEMTDWKFYDTRSEWLAAYAEFKKRS